VIADRLYQRLHLFESALGDFAPILGRIVKELSEDFLRADLSEAEQEQRVRDAAWRIENEKQDLNEILHEEQHLIAFDDDFADRLRKMDRLGQAIRPRDLAGVVSRVLERRFQGAWIQPVSTGTDDVTGSNGTFQLHVNHELRSWIGRQLGREQPAR
jgi:AcrR family transcriptional regulator